MFYTYTQNNSGGKWDYDEKRGITHHVIIEADSTDDADKKAEQIGLYFDGAGDCPCCGDRWDNAYSWNENDVPTLYSTPIGEEYVGTVFWMEPNREIAIHYKDGGIVWPKTKKVSWEEYDDIRKTKN